MSKSEIEIYDLLTLFRREILSLCNLLVSFGHYRKEFLNLTQPIKSSEVAFVEAGKLMELTVNLEG